MPVPHAASGPAASRGTRRSRRRGNAARIPAAADSRDFSRRLRKWFRQNARDLPWRRTRNAYHVLVSELMLQQTPVSRVLGFYEHFLARFPDLESLAAARASQVTAQWRGLGYYARARNLHKLARRVVREEPARYGGRLPEDPSALRELPGVGDYTAGAVASFAYEKRSALVDTNVARVLQRYFAPHLHARRSRDITQLWAIADAVLPRTGRAVWVHNQALMELGALVCTARVKHCSTCPVRAACATAIRDAGSR